MGFRSSYSKPPAVAANAMVATSQPLATRAGLRVLERGGNAADAAIAAAAVLCVTEPMSTGIGGDCFSLVWQDGRIDALDAAGPAPLSAAPLEPVAEGGPTSVTVPGAVRGWAALAERHGRLGLDACLADAIDAAEQGFAVAPMCAHYWERAPRIPPELGPLPAVGEVRRLAELGATLRRIAEQGPDGFYGGPVGEAICAASWLEQSDLDAYAPRWVEPISSTYRGVTVVEMPPPNQGVVALEALGLLEPLEPTLANQVHCVRLALEDGMARVRDGADVSELLDPAYWATRRAAIPGAVTEPPGGTVYLCAVDGDGLAVSFIQSLFFPFGSGVVAPGTGVVLQNRGFCFDVSGRVEPGRRPYHTIIPGMLLRDGGLWGPFGVMGGFIQAQAHAQLVHGLVDLQLDPQAALDRPRFRVEGERLMLEEGFWPHADEFRSTGLELVEDDDVRGFGGGQAILREGEVLVGGSDPRKDGYAAGF
ncbi:MAG: gamma-glutamyltransferase [Thermoleophilia bacterium]